MALEIEIPKIAAKKTRLFDCETQIHSFLNNMVFDYSEKFSGQSHIKIVSESSMIGFQDEVQVTLHVDEILYPGLPDRLRETFVRGELCPILHELVKVPTHTQLLQQLQLLLLYLHTATENTLNRHSLAMTTALQLIDTRTNPDFMPNS
jgi:hypothetical protein